MLSKILTKLVDEAITPAILLLSVRLISVVLVAKYFQIPFDITTSGFTFKTTESYIIINSYSTFLMIVVLTIGLLYVLAKSLIFHETHIKPETTAKLFSVNMDSVMQSSYDLYTQGSIWLSYCYLVMVVSGVMSYYKLIYSWVFVVALVLCVISTVLLILDVENEIKIAKKKDPEYDNNKEYLAEKGNPLK